MAGTNLKFVDPSNTIEFQRQVINNIAADIHGGVPGTADLNVARIQIVGADIGVVSDQIDKIIFFIMEDLLQIEQYLLLISLPKSLLTQTQQWILTIQYS